MQGKISLSSLVTFLFCGTLHILTASIVPTKFDYYICYSPLLQVSGKKEAIFRELHYYNDVRSHWYPGLMCHYIIRYYSKHSFIGKAHFVSFIG